MLLNSKIIIKITNNFNVEKFIFVKFLKDIKA